MPTTFPPSMRPPTKSGATGFMAAAAALAVATAGLAWWKLADKPARPAPSTAAPQALAPTEHNYPLPPPPPPPSAVPEAPKKIATPKGAAPGGCSGGCTGSAPADLQAALRAKAGAARACYERALRMNPMLQGRMTVGVRVSATGRACGASIVQNSLGDASVASCVVALMGSGTLPAPSGGCVDVQIPMTFVGKM